MGSVFIRWLLSRCERPLERLLVRYPVWTLASGAVIAFAVLVVFWRSSLCLIDTNASLFRSRPSSICAV